MLNIIYSIKYTTKPWKDGYALLCWCNSLTKQGVCVASVKIKGKGDSKLNNNTAIPYLRRQTTGEGKLVIRENWNGWQTNKWLNTECVPFLKSIFLCVLKPHGHNFNQCLMFWCFLDLVWVILVFSFYNLPCPLKHVSNWKISQLGLKLITDKLQNIIGAF